MLNKTVNSAGLILTAGHAVHGRALELGGCACVPNIPAENFAVFAATNKQVVAVTAPEYLCDASSLSLQVVQEVTLRGCVQTNVSRVGAAGIETRLVRIKCYARNDSALPRRLAVSAFECRYDAVLASRA